MGKLLKEGIKQRNIVLLDGIVHLFQPYFLLLSTFYVICSYIYTIVPFYTNVLYAILPIEVWTLIGIGQYFFPVVVLAKIHDLITGIITEYGVLIEPYEDMIRQLARKLRRNIND